MKMVSNLTKTTLKGYPMILTRKITRSFDIYQEVEITEELLNKFEEHGLELDLEDVTHAYNESAYADIWDMFEEIHMDTEDVIYEEDVDNIGNYEDEVEYGIEDVSSIKDRKYNVA